jgi:hypothetical protein
LRKLQSKGFSIPVTVISARAVSRPDFTRTAARPLATGHATPSSMRTTLVSLEVNSRLLVICPTRAFPSTRSTTSCCRATGLLRVKRSGMMVSEAARRPDGTPALRSAMAKHAWTVVRNHVPLRQDQNGRGDFRTLFLMVFAFSVVLLT